MDRKRSKIEVFGDAPVRCVGIRLFEDRPEKDGCAKLLVDYGEYSFHVWGYKELKNYLCGF